MDAVKNIIVRDYENPEIQKFLVNLGIIMDEAVNYGTHIIQWVNDNPKNDYTDITLTMLLHHFVENLDGISVLLKNGCVNATEALLRSQFETLLGIEYILQSDSNDRSISYLIMHAHNKLKLFKKADHSTQEGIAFKNKVRASSQTKSVIIPTKNFKKEIDQLNNYLNKTEYIKHETEYKTNSKAIKWWFSFFNGPKSIDQLSSILGYSGYYETFYRSLSGGVHATSALDNAILSNGIPSLLAIRDISNIKTYSKTAIVFSSKVFEKLVMYFNPSNKEYYDKNIKANFSKWLDQLNHD